MLKNWGSWFGTDNENGEVKEEDASKEDKLANAETEQSSQKKDTQPSQLLPTGVGGYIYNFASSASRKLSESVAGTAQTLRKSVEEGKLNEIIDKTILGDFQKEQERFVMEKKAKKFDAALPPWVGYNEEDSIQEQILALSADKRNFLRNPPAGVQFNFDFEEMYPVAMVMLEEDELLRKMRFHLVPKQVKEEIFWKNYFYRVSLIKQSAQLTALAAHHAAKTVDLHQKESDVIKHQSSPAVISPKPKTDEEEISTSPPVAEFISDAFDSCKINQDDLQRGMEQLVLDQREGPDSQQEEMADWERELQEELQEYDVLADNENHDENWDRELEEMLQKDG